MERLCSSSAASVSGRASSFFDQSFCHVSNCREPKRRNAFLFAEGALPAKPLSKLPSLILEAKQKGFQSGIQPQLIKAFLKPLPHQSLDAPRPPLPSKKNSRQVATYATQASTATPESPSSKAATSSAPTESLSSPAPEQPKPETSAWEEPLVFEVGVDQRTESGGASSFSIKKPERDFQWRRSQVIDVEELERDTGFMTRTVRLVQWYPGHIAKAERQLKEQLKLVDVVLEVRDARIPMATTHPEMSEWIGDRRRLLVMNREDQISNRERSAWRQYFRAQGETVVWTNGQAGDGILKLTQEATRVSGDINAKREAKGLLPRPVRCAVIGYPNVGKSAIINRLLKRRVANSAPRPGVTRELIWLRIGANLDLLDSPGVLPARLQDQAAAARLAICNDIGQAAYAVAGVAVILIEYVKRSAPKCIHDFEERYKLLGLRSIPAETYLENIAQKLFNGDVDVAAHRVLKDYRGGKLGNFALEKPPRTY